MLWLRFEFLVISIRLSEIFESFLRWVFLSIRKLLLLFGVKDSGNQELWLKVVQNHCKLRFFCFSTNNSPNSMGYVSKWIKMSYSTVQNDEEASTWIQIYWGKILKMVLVFVFSYTGVGKKKEKTGKHYMSGDLPLFVLWLYNFFYNSTKFQYFFQP